MLGHFARPTRGARLRFPTSQGRPPGAQPCTHESNVRQMPSITNLRVPAGRVVWRRGHAYSSRTRRPWHCVTPSNPRPRGRWAVPSLQRCACHRFECSCLSALTSRFPLIAAPVRSPGLFAAAARCSCGQSRLLRTSEACGVALVSSEVCFHLFDAGNCTAGAVCPLKRPGQAALAVLVCLYAAVVQRSCASPIHVQLFYPACVLQSSFACPRRGRARGPPRTRGARAATRSSVQRPGP